MYYSDSLFLDYAQVIKTMCITITAKVNIYLQSKLISNDLNEMKDRNWSSFCLQILYKFNISHLLTTNIQL